jgi:hypothetical protein
MHAFQNRLAAAAMPIAHPEQGDSINITLHDWTRK